MDCSCVAMETQYKDENVILKDFNTRITANTERESWGLFFISKNAVFVTSTCY